MSCDSLVPRLSRRPSRAAPPIARELATALEAADASFTASFAAAHRASVPGSRAGTIAFAGGLAVRTATGWPINRAIAWGLNAPVGDADLAEVEAFFDAIDEPARLDATPFHPAEGLAGLQARGYRIERFLNLHLAVASALRPRSPAPVVREVTDDRARQETWIWTAARGFAGEQHLADDDLDLAIARLNTHRSEVRLFLAEIAGEPAGAGALATTTFTAPSGVPLRVHLLFSTGVRAAWRRRGVHRALLDARLAVAAQQGGFVMSLAIPGSRSGANLLAAGLAVAYTRVTLRGPRG